MRMSILYVGLLLLLHWGCLEMNTARGLHWLGSRGDGIIFGRAGSACVNIVHLIFVISEHWGVQLLGVLVFMSFDRTKFRGFGA